MCNGWKFLWRVKIDKLSSKKGFEDQLSSCCQEKYFCVKGNFLLGALISAPLNIWISRLRWQQTIYFCLLHWPLSLHCTGCFLFYICGSGVVTYWLNSQRVVVCTRKFESKMALKWSHSGLGCGESDDRIHSIEVLIQRAAESFCILIVERFYVPLI